MAISPLVVHSGATDPKITAANAKALAVRTSNNGKTQSRSVPGENTGPELAEQLNEEEKQKYVKG